MEKLCQCYSIFPQICGKIFENSFCHPFAIQFEIKFGKSKEKVPVYTFLSESTEN